MAKRSRRLLGWMAATWAAVFFVGAGFRVLADCSGFGLPFTDLGSETTFCAAIAEAYYTGITGGTSSTTFSPNDPITRSQGAAFAVRTLDAALTRGGRRAALGQWWTSTPHYDAYGSPGLTAVGTSPKLLKSDGADIWVANYGSGFSVCVTPSDQIRSTASAISLGGTVSRVRASDGKKLEDWTGADHAYGVLVAMGRVFVTGYTSPGSLYMIDPSGAVGDVTTVASDLGDGPLGIAFDGSRIWTTNYADSSISIITPGASVPWSVTTKSIPSTAPTGIVFDGSHIWVTNNGGGAILKLDSDGNILQTVAVGSYPAFPAFDGRNLWVPNGGSQSLTVLRVSDGTVLKTFSAANGDQNGLSDPYQAEFDGQRILVTNPCGGLSLFKAADLSIIGTLPASGADFPFGVCSDGLNFWVSFENSGNIGRF